MNYIKPEDIKSYVEQNPTGVAGMSEELSTMVNHFAELIVKECIDIAYEYDAPKMSGPGMIIGNRIEEHFRDGMSTEDKKTLIKELLGVKND